MVSKTVNFVAVFICVYLSIGHCAHLDYEDEDGQQQPAESSSYLHYCSSLDSTQKLSKNYAQILASGNFSDVHFVVGKEKREFRLHRSILYSRCPAIGKWFVAKESQAFSLPDESADVFEQFIQFVYVGRVGKMNQFARELLVMANKYQMNCLKFICVQHLSNLSTQSVTSTLVFADQYNVADLKAKCVAFITEHAREVMASEDWKQLKDKPDLLLELMDNLVRKYVPHKAVEEVEHEPRSGRTWGWGRNRNED